MCSLLFIFFAFFLANAEVVNRDGKGDRLTPAAASGLLFDYPPEIPRYSTAKNGARCYGNQDWNKLSFNQKGTYLFSMYEKLLNLHQDKNDPNSNSYKFSPRILVCKTFKESTFDTQIMSGLTTAAGLAQVVDETADDTFTRGFRSKIPGYENIEDGATFRRIMRGDPVAQMELGLAVMEMKRRDWGLSGDSVQPVLERYYGGSETVRKEYAEDIYRCAKCANENGNSFPLKCLCNPQLPKKEYESCLATDNTIPTEPCSNYF